jgi:hypothetical protein
MKIFLCALAGGSPYGWGEACQAPAGPNDRLPGVNNEEIARRKKLNFAEAEGVCGLLCRPIGAGARSMRPR